MSSKSNMASKSESTTPSGGITSKAVEKNNLKSTPTTQTQCVLSEADRQQMIATAAYYRAEKRGFDNGDEMQDWLEAEAEAELDYAM